MKLNTVARDALVALVGSNANQIMTAADIVRDPSGEGKALLAYIRKYGTKEGRGQYLIDPALLTANADVKVSPAPKAPKPAPVEADEAPLVENIPSIVTAKSRMRSTDLNYDAITVPKKDPSYVPFGVASILKKIISSGHFAPIYIQGDSGYGKTMATEQVCATLKRPLAIVNITNETSEDDLIGGLRIVSGDTVFEYGPVIRAYRDGAVLLLDELDQGTSQIMCLQTILQKKPYFIKKTGETIHPHPDFMVVATGNTKGIGDDFDGRFVGAQQLNDAFLERFSVTFVHTAPSSAIETKILVNQGVEKEVAEILVKWANITREAAKNGVIDREIQTRRLGHIVTNYKVFGDMETSIKLALNRFPEVVADSMLRMYTACAPAPTAPKNVTTDGEQF